MREDLPFARRQAAIVLDGAYRYNHEGVFFADITIDAAGLMVKGKVRLFRKIIMPMLLPGICISWVVIFAFVFSEVDLGVLLIPPGIEILSIKIYSLMHYGAGPVVAALSIMLLGIIFIVAITIITVSARFAARCKSTGFSK